MGRIVALIAAPLFLVAILIGSGAVIYQAVKTTEGKEKFREIRESLLVKYADTNHNGVVSKEEEEALDSAIYSANNSILVNGKAYQNGKRVSTTILTEWFKNYQPTTTPEQPTQ